MRLFFSPFFFLLILTAVVRGGFEEPVAKTSRPGTAISFVNSDSRSESESREIIAQAAARFTRVTGMEVGYYPIIVDFVEEIPRGIRGVLSRQQGSTTFRPAGATVAIAVRGPQTCGRILAHEVAHVFTREAYGDVENPTLREGLAEWIAGQAYPSEVRENMRNARRGGTPPSLVPYVDGYQFCHRHAEHKDFATFYEQQVHSKTTSYDALEKLWERHLAQVKLSDDAAAKKSMTVVELDK